MPSTFRVMINGVWTIPPVYARPASNDLRMQYAPVVIYPPAAGRDGYGYPIRMDAELRAQIGRPIINSDGQTFWYTTVGSGFVNGYALRNVTLWNPKDSSWTDYSGVMWEPTYGGGVPGNKLYDFVIRITNLSPI